MGSLAQHGGHGVRQLPESDQEAVLCLGQATTFDATAFGRQAEGQEESSGDLCVERFGRRDTHLDVTAVRGVEHAVGFLNQIGVTAVNDANHDCPARPDEVDSAVGVCGRPALRDRYDEAVAHVLTDMKARELGCDDVSHTNVCAAERLIERSRNCPTGNGCRALADDVDGVAGLDPVPNRARQRHLWQPNLVTAVTIDDLAAKGSAHARRRLGDLFEQEMRGVTAVDIACGDPSAMDVALRDRQLGPVVREPRHPL